MSLAWLIILIVIVVGGLPTWGHHNFGYAPSSIGGLVLLVVVILLLTGRL